MLIYSDSDEFGNELTVDIDEDGSVMFQITDLWFDGQMEAVLSKDQYRRLFSALLAHQLIG